jgi:hypothetical protein
MAPKYTCSICDSALADGKPKTIQRHESSNKHIKALYSKINDGLITDESIIVNAKKEKAIVDKDSYPVIDSAKSSMYRVHFNGKTKNFRYVRCDREEALKKAEAFRQELIRKYTLE